MTPTTPRKPADDKKEEHKADVPDPSILALYRINARLDGIEESIGALALAVLIVIVLYWLLVIASA